MPSAAARQAAISSAETCRCRARAGYRSATSAAERRFCCAITLVNTLLSAIALYSSGPVTPSMRNVPELSR